MCLDNNLELYFGITVGGYVWIVPHKIYCSVGIDGVAKDSKHTIKSQIDLLRKNGFFGKYGIHGHKILRGGVERRFIGLEFS